MTRPEHFHTIIIGAGAAGLFAARYAGRAGSVAVLDHAKKPGEKIRISGGGRCNFTNLSVGPENFLGENSHFAKSALARFTPWDFIDLLHQHGIAWHEKTLGQLFCDGSATQIVDMLLMELRAVGGELRLQSPVSRVARAAAGFRLETPRGALTCRNLIIATGGKSIPKMGATGFAYDIARQFGLRVTDTRPGLVPLTFPNRRFAALSGLSLPVRATAGGATFAEAMLFTHRGLSGPAILQISSFWREGAPIHIDLLPGTDLTHALRARRKVHGRRRLATELAEFLPARLVEARTATLELAGNLADMSDARLYDLETRLHDWCLTPNGTEGYRKAEVTLGGVATDALDSRSMQVRAVPGLFFIGEAVDVTGWLGGYNFHWAWASAHAAGIAIAPA